jgi:hypothetical protein
VAEQRRHDGFLMATMPSGGQRWRGQVSEDQREKEHDESGPFWLGEGEQRSSPWSKEGGSLSAGGAQGGPLHGEVPECGISSARWGPARPVLVAGVVAL